MTDQHSLTNDQDEKVYFSAKLSPGLRWVLRDGRPVLQQAWQVTKYHTGTPVGAWPEWRDVPMENEHG